MANLDIDQESKLFYHASQIYFRAHCNSLLFVFITISGYGTGSIFWFSVPTHLNETDLQKKMIKYQDKDDVSNASEEIVRYIPCKKLKSEEKIIKSAFIIGESISIRKFLQKALLTHEYRVIEGDNFSQGVQTMKTTRFDLVFCDFLMPAAHGLECIKHYREWEQGHRKSQTVRIYRNWKFLCNQYVCFTLTHLTTGSTFR